MKLNTKKNDDTLPKSEQTAEGTHKKPIYYRRSIEILRLILMFLMCVNLFGFPLLLGGAEQTLCGFVPIAFFILSGFLVLREGENREARIVRAIIRTAVTFVVLAVVYGLLNYFYYKSLGTNILTALQSKRLWFNFVVLNVWPFSIGGAIWYVQSLLYAYIIIFFLNKWKLLKHDWKIAAVLILFTILTGEMAGIIRWDIAGYNYIPGNFLTRALPYVLLGGFLHRKKAVWQNIHTAFFILGILAGILMMCAEIFFLGKYNLAGYYGHLIGMPVTAASMCLIAFQGNLSDPEENKYIPERWATNCIYYVCQPVSVGLVYLLSFLGNEAMVLFPFLGIIIFLISLFLAWIVGKIGLAFKRKKKRT